MPKRPCLEPGCGEYASQRGRCVVHARQQARAKGPRIYDTKRWRLTRRRKLYLNPLCEWDGCRELAEDVHHKHGADVEPWAMDGLQSLCHSHHSQVTRAGQAA